MKNRKTLRQISILNNIPFDLPLITLTLNLTLTYLTLPLCIYNTLTQWRSKLDSWADSIAYIHVHRPSKQPIWKQINCAEHEYMNMYLSIIEFATTMLWLITGQLVYDWSGCKLENVHVVVARCIVSTLVMTTHDESTVRMNCDVTNVRNME